MASFSVRSIGVIHSPFTDVSQIPKGVGALHQAAGALELLPEFAPGLDDIEGFSHLYVIWLFNRSQGFSLRVTPPSDDKAHGVFATRSPWRPNPVGLTVVELLGREGARLRVRGVDMLDGSPILDIKPYLRRGWMTQAETRLRDRQAPS
jgi:tRNA-Thr(GGU) m(6)t(6)A37 methyltransferase TsaA